MDRKRNIAAIAAALVVALVGAAGWFIAYSGPSVIRIGVSQPLSGPIANMGQDMLNGARLAAEEINAAGGVKVGGKSVPIEIITADDKSDAEAGKAAAKALVDADVVAVIAHLNSGVSIAAAPLYAARGIPQLAISTKPQYTQLGFPTTFRLVANDDLQGAAMSSFAMQLPKAERFAIVDDGSPFGVGLANSVAKTLSAQGKHVAVHKSMDDKTTAFAAFVAEVADAKADVLLSVLSDFQVAAVLTELEAKGMTEVRVIGADSSKTDRTLGAGPAISGVYATSPIVDAKEFPNGKAFIERFRARFQVDPIYGAQYAYDAVYLLADAMSRNRSLDKARLIRRLKEFDGNAPVTGSMRFREDGELRYGSVAIYRRTKGRWEAQMRSSQW
jgi:branched-chain amino acid transport system substrate-binding protein